MIEIQPTELAAIDGAIILDVREDHEFAEVRAATAVSIPMSQFVDRFDEVPVDETLYVICAAGGRSAQVAQYLEQRGYEAVNVAGGTGAWVAAGLPTLSGAPA
ncbi:rhodanese-like domain-containing protein [Microterricola viridarii]|uniref:Sulfurtransferase n=1 Tax=Microterricola viridarii TaxID=412690 RepID=A0A120I144_9MICO|nr:rhodanese-like domain-containing protein [Microterricola viridarii]AMB59252.1 sulfurtransferase [Microterricola viridarii]